MVKLDEIINSEVKKVLQKQEEQPKITIPKPPEPLFITQNRKNPPQQTPRQIPPQQQAPPIQQQNMFQNMQPAQPQAPNYASLFVQINMTKEEMDALFNIPQNQKIIQNPPPRRPLPESKPRQIKTVEKISKPPEEEKQENPTIKEIKEIEEKHPELLLLRINTVKNDLNKFKNEVIESISEIDKTLTEHEEKFTEIESKINELYDIISEMNNTLPEYIESKIQTALTDIVGEIDRIKANIITLNLAFKNLTDAINEKITEMENRIYTTDMTIHQLNNSLNELANQIEEIKKEVHNIKQFQIINNDYTEPSITFKYYVVIDQELPAESQKKEPIELKIEDTPSITIPEEIIAKPKEKDEEELPEELKELLETAEKSKPTHINELLAQEYAKETERFFEEDIDLNKQQIKEFIKEMQLS